MKSGFIVEPDEVYHAEPDHMGSSHIKATLPSMAHFKSFCDGKKLISKALRSTFDIGTCAHEINLERTRNKYIVAPHYPDKRCAEYKKFVLENPDKIILTPAEDQMLREMSEVWDKNKAVQALMSGARIELSAYGMDHETGVLVKGRMDAIQGSTIIDYKTSGLKDFSDRSIANEIVNRGYHISAACYMAVCELNGLKIDRYILIFQEKKSPYAIRIIELSKNFILEGMAIRATALQKIAGAVTKNSFPGFPEEITTLDLPTWAHSGEIWALEENEEIA